MLKTVIEALPQIPVAQQRSELVERKGVGRPDTMCDAMLEQIALALCQAYLASYGHVLHCNLDKGLLIAECRADRAAGMLLSYDTFKDLPRHVCARDIGVLLPDGQLVSLREGGEFFC